LVWSWSRKVQSNVYGGLGRGGEGQTLQARCWRNGFGRRVYADLLNSEIEHRREKNRVPSKQYRTGGFYAHDILNEKKHSPTGK